jgi:DNA-binding Lrp family transcriptional regulator
MSGSATFTIVTSMSSMHAPVQIATKGHHLRIFGSFHPFKLRGGPPASSTYHAALYRPPHSQMRETRRFSTSASVLPVESITVDDLDRQLTQCLGIDGRASFSAVAEVLGVSDQTIARRYRRLRSAGALRVVGLRNPKSGGYANWILRLQCVPGSGEAIAAALAGRNDTAWVQLLSGDTEVLCSLRGDATESLLTRLPRSGRIVAVTALSRLHMFAGGPDALGFLDVLPAARTAPLRAAASRTRQQPQNHGPQNHQSPGHGEGASDLDDALFAALAADGRAPYADLAAATGWSETTVRRRMEQLRDCGQLYYDLELDMPSFGFRSSAWLWMSVAPSHLAQVGGELVKFPEVAYVTATTGPTNLAACVVCRDEESLYEFLTAQVGALPGVERVETAPVIRTVKQASPVMAPRP